MHRALLIAGSALAGAVGSFVVEKLVGYFRSEPSEPPPFPILRPYARSKRGLVTGLSGPCDNAELAETGDA
jgi:hypothetical protein